MIPKWVSGDLADLGCGKAPLLGAYGPRCRSVTLADWSNSAHDNPYLDLLVDLNEPLSSLQTSSFDVVLLSDVLEHIREPGLLMAEISRILKPGGRLLLNVPFIYWIHEAPHDYYRYTSFALERFVNNSGLEVVELVPLGGWVEVMGDLWSKFFAFAGLKWMAAAIHHAVAAFGNTFVGRRLTNRSGKVLPLGYGLVARKPMVNIPGAQVT
ncbi:class I SAM-dependent methyltransferase [Mycobacterium sp. 852013-51886_SCH5428379]|uniref:class I SAM-dependent methyltransferase n=1 Tax=Mycobacterium sp. 852013-51886_SCH5428379 TaxID=1834111 RepID=UPI0018D38645|nr:class I SAM-dependent methyltransferase [Mycobacterium sp. 852013-51886_SCH5428379]